MATKTDRARELPAKFNASDRRAYVWLYDCGIRGWVVDLATGTVSTVKGEKFKSLTEFAESMVIEIKG